MESIIILIEKKQGAKECVYFRTTQQNVKNFKLSISIIDKIRILELWYSFCKLTMALRSWFIVEEL